MAGAVQLQADVSSLGIQGLGALPSVLATLSADNVASVAILQVQELGSLFNVNGRFAEQTPDLLTRFSARPLGRLKIAIGWRKGDSASLLAETAGGQAAALLAVVLRNLFPKDRCGEIIYQSCASLLSPRSATASVSQLSDVADMLANKMFAVGFGNFLAKHILRLGNAFDSLDLQQPHDLMDDLTVDSASELLNKLSLVSRQESAILRITGTSGMGLILGMVLFLFPNNAMVTVDGTIIHEGSSLKIFLEIVAGPVAPAAMTLEERVIAGTSRYPLFTIECHRLSDGFVENRFQWRGWLADELRLSFARPGLPSTEEDLLAFSNLLIALVHHDFHDYGSITKWYKDAIPCPRLAELLGPNRSHRMTEVCRDILRVSPATAPLDLRDAFIGLAAPLQERVSKCGMCSCDTESSRCHFPSGWKYLATKAHKNCRARQLWSRLGECLQAGLACFFIHPSSNVTTLRPIRSLFDSRAVQGMITRALSLVKGQGFPYSITSKKLYLTILDLVQSVQRDDLAVSSSSTIYPQVLETLEIHCDQVACFRLIDGMIMFQDRYHRQMFDGPASARPMTKKSLIKSGSPFVPSSLGEHARVIMTVRETAAGLELRTSVQYSGEEIKLQLFGIIHGYMTMLRTTACSHPVDRPLLTTDPPVLATSVAAPCASKSDTIAVVMVRANPSAQFLCCEPKSRPLLSEECCLDCAIEEAIDRDCSMIVVA